MSWPAGVRAIQLRTIALSNHFAQTGFLKAMLFVTWAARAPAGRDKVGEWILQNSVLPRT